MESQKLLGKIKHPFTFNIQGVSILRNMRKVIVRTLILLITACSCLSASAATRDKQYRFWVEYSDKNGSIYSLLNPWDFLSEKALARRNRVGYAVNMQDLPVNRNYIQSVAETGVRVLLSSRWMNATLVATSDTALAAQIAALPCVKQVSLVGIYYTKRGIAELAPDAVTDYSVQVPEAERILTKNKSSEDTYNKGYGLGWDQIHQLQGEVLHERGYRGKGIQIAVFDAGFYRANMMQAFDSLFQSGRVLGTYDLVDGGTNVFNDDDHGTQVLSCMAAWQPGVMIGTAPEASYLLIRTEDAGTEMPCEEITWLCAAELADSAGVDMISSSLGYTEFDDKRFGHTYADLNGNTTIITRAANMVWDRGVIVVNSAGNEGDSRWKYIGAPADAAGVIAVGAVDGDGLPADFSSVGPTVDKRIKPDVVAMGKRTTVINSNGYFIRSNGTSYSAPVLAGALACFLQATGIDNPVRTRNLLLLSADHFLNGNNQTGKGLPNFDLALKMLFPPKNLASNPFMGWPENDTVYTALHIKTTYAPSPEGYQYKLKNAIGLTIESGMLFPYEDALYAALLQPRDRGHYKLEIQDGKKKWNCKFYFAGENKKSKDK